MATNSPRRPLQALDRKIAMVRRGLAVMEQRALTMAGVDRRVASATIADAKAGLERLVQARRAIATETATGARREPPLADLGGRIRAALSDDLRSSRYRGIACSTAGHCYVASEAAYHALGGPASGFTPQFVRHEGEPHWYLKHDATGLIVDLTADQFATPVPYAQGRGKGFLTKEPSKRARVILERIAPP